MNWTWRQLAHYLGAVRIQVEFQGITEDGLAKALHQSAIQRLEWVKAILFDEEIDDAEKVKVLQEWFCTEEI